MQRYFIPHKLSIGDISHLSDKDSSFVISQNLHTIEDPVEIYNLNSIFLAIITNIEKASVEIEIIQKIEDIKPIKTKFHITLMQSLINEQRFNLILEKAVEVGIHTIIPIWSEYSTQTIKKTQKNLNGWSKIIKEAQQQSRNPYKTEIKKPIKLEQLNNVYPGHKLCLSTENKQKNTLHTTLKNKEPLSEYTIAIGPERGWSTNDIKHFDRLKFEYITLGKNILRSETAGLVVASVLNFKAKIY